MERCSLRLPLFSRPATARRLCAEKTPAFTLIELLVVLAIVAVLAGLVLPVFGQVRSRADRVTAVSQMHQIAVALGAYPADNGGQLPGPLFPGQMPMLDPARNGRLALSLASYLDITVPITPQLIPLFIPPAYKHSVTAAFLNDARTFVMNMSVPLAGGSTINPWGNAATGVGGPLAASLVPGQTWAFSDADQLHPRVVGASWSANTPPFKVHGAHRLAVRFDGSAGDVDDAELAIPPP